MDTTKFTASKQATTNAKFVVVWHQPHSPGSVTRCYYCTKKAAVAQAERMNRHGIVWAIWGAL